MFIRGPLQHLLVTVARWTSGFQGTVWRRSVRALACHKRSLIAACMRPLCTSLAVDSEPLSCIGTICPALGFVHGV